MLRYAHHMPAIFEQSFLQGLNNGSVQLAGDWRIRVHILNILSLLDCLVKGTPKKRPNQCADIQELIHHILEQLDKNNDRNPSSPG
ncbi:hypothetical protein [Candidatus Finniella inopinata]|uniref:Uncharacterized protein n=1 Tax=Candidatus Finniella inopinata TaxID=1696036 RepID=A0A4V2DZN2_9PROT|nr:hypothetical protein [Candidatus Finniella inopinata]RZI45647.1 hypothetical protein EQU50_05975 [Candidatus Finniella inopinata]